MIFNVKLPLPVLMLANILALNFRHFNIEISFWYFDFYLVMICIYIYKNSSNFPWFSLIEKEYGFGFINKFQLGD